LRGEKIDIVLWHVDSAKFVCNALAPAEISKVVIDEDNRSMEVLVADEFLSLAIGKRGQNVRLASKLVKWHLDVISEEQYNAAMKKGLDTLTELPGMEKNIADRLSELGFFSAKELAKADVQDLLQIEEVDEDSANILIESAKKYMADSRLRQKRVTGNDDTEQTSEDNDDYSSSHMS
jgi:N utilization substance protein A